jgi:PAS domain S-box-containing protein
MKAEEALRASELKYRSLIESSTDVVFCVNEQGQYQFTNQVFASTFGKTPDYFVGKTFRDVYPEEHAAYRYEATKRVFQTGKSESLVVTVPLPDKTLYFHATASPIKDETGKTILALTHAVDITERMMAEDAIKRREEQIHLILDSIGEALYGIDLQGNCTFANPACCKMLGYAAQEELIGKNMHQLIHHSYPDGRPMPVEVCEIFQAFIAGKGTHNDNEVLWRKDGTSFPMEYWSHPQIVNSVVHGAVVVFQDITLRKKAEDELKQTATRLLLATRAGGVGVWDYDLINNILTWDNSMYALYGITKDTFGGAYESWKAGLHPDDLARGHAETQMALSGEKEFDTAFRVIWPDGSLHDIRALAVVQRDGSGKPLRMVGTNWDITAQKQLERDIKQGAEIRSNFASMVSHELRSPLSVITLGISFLLEDAVGLSAEHKSMLELVNDNANRLGRLINTVLDFQKITAGKMPFHIEENDVAGLVNETARSMAILAQKKGLVLTSDLAPDLPRIRFDRDKITQVLTNLLSNAIAHTEKGNITIHAVCEGDKLHISVRDTGHGIKAEDLPKLFQAFEQLDSGGKRQKGGTGLGLAISKEILLAHEGRIWAESEPGQGSVFHFTLPVKHGGNL